MTKQIRVENACMANYKVNVLVQDRVYDPEKEGYTEEWFTVETRRLDFPTALENLYIHSSRRLVIEEASF
jgi:hypothetical protein